MTSWELEEWMTGRGMNTSDLLRSLGYSGGSQCVRHYLRGDLAIPRKFELMIKGLDYELSLAKQNDHALLLPQLNALKVQLQETMKALE